MIYLIIRKLIRFSYTFIFLVIAGFVLSWASYGLVAEFIIEIICPITPVHGISFQMKLFNVWI